ncbi:MAG: hypothetical protein ACOX0K_07880 [Oscillospiraceae bacterium]
MQGCLEVLALANGIFARSRYGRHELSAAAGAHGEYAGLLLIRAYHHSRGDTRRTNIIVPDSATVPTRPAPSWQAFG